MVSGVGLGGVAVVDGVVVGDVVGMGSSGMGMVLGEKGVEQRRWRLEPLSSQKSSANGRFLLDVGALIARQGEHGHGSSLLSRNDVSAMGEICIASESEKVVELDVNGLLSVWNEYVRVFGEEESLGRLLWRQSSWRWHPQAPFQSMWWSLTSVKSRAQGREVIVVDGKEF